MEDKTDAHKFDDNEPWIYGGGFKTGDVVHVKFPIQAQQDAITKFKDIFTSKPLSKRSITIQPGDKLTISSTPLEHLGGGLHGSYYPLTYTLKTVDGKVIMAVPESVLEGSK